jgi:ADP-ribose pyrophosphatase YjhB (NUDIX family)
MSLAEQMYLIADELRGIASTGLYFTEDRYDRERYEKVLSLSARLLGALEGKPSEEILSSYTDTLHHMSPLVGVSTAVLKEGGILLIQREDNGLWAIPGGLVEVGEVLSQAALRELEEEAGVEGEVVDLLGIFDSQLWKTFTKSHLVHVVFLVEAANPVPAPGSEALAAGFFAEDRLPELSPGQVRRLPVIFRILRGEIQRPYFDGRAGEGNPYGSG